MTSLEKKMIFIFVSAAVLLQAAAFFPEFQSGVFELFSNSEKRVVLAKVDGSLKVGQPTLRFVKFIQGGLVQVEAYLLNDQDHENSEHTLLGSLKLREGRDAYLTLKSKATNLGLSDVDMDGELEILVPTFDNDLIPRLHAYKFNLEYNTFESVY